ncbi:two-component system LytT family response regulator [Filimonas zeae]|uniref:DNA-binding response regulator n=1 Tax=Filimonas zeae TaxID=1737353 RepID=A0A917MU62_9BACT|nr:LytTR family DNA-binding domain-containing protein [Filimonas zeae]MDR6339342.1 two-component system LytT family response regulator [Filimonas zeae]GGH64030.1 DNA-binding response regulator [Filimonas zeae]
MRVVIIEDERPNILRLKKLLAEIDATIEVVATLDTVTGSVAWFQENEAPDVALMDIRIADGLSFDIFPKVHVPCPVIFTTAYDEYAVRAFKVNSLDYLLKPVEKDDLQQALAKVNVAKEPQDANVLVQQLLELVNKKQPAYRTRFMIPFRDGYKTVNVSEVDFIHYSHTITYLVLKDGNQLPISLTMEELEEQLNPEEFFRVNRQHIIHAGSIDSIQNYSGSKLRIVLKRDPQREIMVSREKVPVFKEWLDK